MTSIISRFVLMVLSFLWSTVAVAQDQTWNKKNAQEWFNKMEWLNPGENNTVEVQYDQFGRVLESSNQSVSSNKTLQHPVRIKPHHAIDVVEFAKQYHEKETLWNEVFNFIQNTNLDTLQPGKYILDGDNVIYTVVEGPTRKIDTTNWESHLKYQDVHFIIKGRERIGITDNKGAQVVIPYDDKRDIIFYRKKGKYEIAETGDLFIFFPGDLHRPNLAVKENEYVKKIVFKVKRSDK